MGQPEPVRAVKQQQQQALTLPPALSEKLSPAGYTNRENFPSTSDHSDWQMVKEDCVLTNPELIWLKNVLFHPAGLIKLYYYSKCLF